MTLKYKINQDVFEQAMNFVPDYRTVNIAEQRLS